MIPQEGTRKPHIFVSHRSADAHLAELLANEIRQAGYPVWLDEWELGIGDSIIERMDSGLAKAGYLVLCYSQDGVHSPWMSREWMSTLARQLEGHKVKILPVRLSGGKPPAILADIRYADLVKDWSRGIADLMKAMK